MHPNVAIQNLQQSELLFFRFYCNFFLACARFFVPFLFLCFVRDVIRERVVICCPCLLYWRFHMLFGFVDQPFFLFQ